MGLVVVLVACASRGNTQDDPATTTGGVGSESSGPAAPSGESSPPDVPSPGDPTSDATSSGEAEGSEASGTQDASDTATSPSEPFEPWPDSSLCLGMQDNSFCGDGIGARDWQGADDYRWHSEGGEAPFVVTRAAMPLFSAVGDGGGIVPWGLGVAPDGDVFASGAGDVLIDGVAVPSNGGYARFVARVGPDGDVRWSSSFAAVSADRVLVAPQSDGGVVIVGDAYDELDIDGVVLTGGTIGFPRVFAAKFADDGALAWASMVPAQGTPEFRVLSIRSGAAGEIEIHGPLRGTLQIGDAELTFPFTEPGMAVVVLTPEGEWASVAAAP